MRLSNKKSLWTCKKIHGLIGINMFIKVNCKFELYKQVNGFYFNKQKVNDFIYYLQLFLL